VPVVDFVTPLAPRPASCRVVAASRLCEASRAGIRIVSQELAKPCVFRVICRISGEEASVGGPRCKKMVLPAAIREKSQRQIALLCDAHSVPSGWDTIGHPCLWSSSESDLQRTFFEHSPFCAGNSGFPHCKSSAEVPSYWELHDHPE